MTFRRGGGGKRRDANEPSLIAGWRAVGAKVWQVSGTGLPDVIVFFRERWFCFEIKTATGTLTDKQGEFPVIRDMEAGLRAVGAVVNQAGGSTWKA